MWTEPEIRNLFAASERSAACVAVTAMWSAVTRHRFCRVADSSAEPSHDSEAGLDECPRVFRFDGDESPAKSGDESPHSTFLVVRERSRAAECGSQLKP